MSAVLKEYIKAHVPAKEVQLIVTGASRRAAKWHALCTRGLFAALKTKGPTFRGTDRIKVYSCINDHDVSVIVVDEAFGLSTEYTYPMTNVARIRITFN